MQDRHTDKNNIGHNTAFWVDDLTLQ